MRCTSGGVRSSERAVNGVLSPASALGGRLQQLVDLVRQPGCSSPDAASAGRERATQAASDGERLRLDLSEASISPRAERAFARDRGAAEAVGAQLLDLGDSHIQVQELNARVTHSPPFGEARDRPRGRAFRGGMRIARMPRRREPAPERPMRHRPSQFHVDHLPVRWDHWSMVVEYLVTSLAVSFGKKLSNRPTTTAEVGSGAGQVFRTELVE